MTLSELIRHSINNNIILFYLTDPFSKPRKIFFKGDRLPFDGIPFMIIGTKIFDCQHGPDRNKNEKAKFSTQKVEKYDNSHF